MLPLCGDPRAHQMLSEALSFTYPPRAFAADYEAARARLPPGGATSSEAAARLEALLRVRHGRLAGLLRAVRMQAVVAVWAGRWGEFREAGLIRPPTSGASERLVARSGKGPGAGALARRARGRMLPIRCIDRALLEGLLRVRVRAPQAPLTGPRLDRRGVERAVARAAHLRH